MTRSAGRRSVGRYSRCALLVGANALLLAHVPAAAEFNPPGREVRPAQLRVMLEVAPGNWGEADVADVQLVLESVAREFLSHVATGHGGELRLRVMPRGTAPRVLFERGGEGEYIVHLTARDQRWYQYAYQFSHELCHILSNFDHKDGGAADHAKANQWFEETLCETASLFTLRRLASSWETSPPARKWVGYAPAFAAYADQLLAAPHRRLPPGRTFDAWFRENRPLLEADPYLRDRNELLAAVLLPLFERDPARWQAIAYLNADTASAGKPLAGYLADWLRACPQQSRAVVRDTMAVLGLAEVATAGAAASTDPNFLLR